MICGWIIIIMVDNLQTTSDELLAQATFLCHCVSSSTAKKKKMQLVAEGLSVSPI